MERVPNCVGVDRAKSGWIAVWWANAALKFFVYDSARALVDAHRQDRVIAVDIPIGLPERNGLASLPSAIGSSTKEKLPPTSASGHSVRRKGDRKTLVTVRDSSSATIRSERPSRKYGLPPNLGTKTQVTWLLPTSEALTRAADGWEQPTSTNALSSTTPDSRICSPFVGCRSPGPRATLRQGRAR